MSTTPAPQRLLLGHVAAAARLAACLSLFLPLPLAAQTPGVPPARATVFIRLVGDLEITQGADQPGGERHVRETNIELSTGSGALISPVGHVLTAAHVVTVESGTMMLGGIRVEVKQTVRRIEVLLPGDESSSFPSAAFEATVLAMDPALDLAVVSVNSANLPFLDLGDSDALSVGDAVEAVGFPFGEQVDIGRPRAAVPVAPAASVSRGNVAAFRADTQGERRYLQVTAPLNAGNSGGPIVDADGYLVAIANSVIRARGSGATGVGFGVPVNLAKRFLESYGLDASLRARRMVVGAPTLLEGKGLRIPLPLGTNDTSPLRTRVDTGPPSAERVTLRADRVVSPWPAGRIAEALVAGRAFEPFSYSTAPPRVPDGAGGRIVMGRATGAMDDGTPARMEYAVIDAGGEKIVARFVGPPYQLAYNASVFRSALRQVEAEPLRAAGRDVPGPVKWEPWRPAGRTPLDSVRLPAGWVVEPAAPFACAGVPSPSTAVAASPPADFTIGLRAGWIPAAALGAQEAAAACGTAGREEASYTRDFTFLGARYRLEGRFLETGGDGLLQLEWVALAEQALAVRAAIGDWMAR